MATKTERYRHEFTPGISLEVVFTDEGSEEAEAEYQAMREANLQRWNVRPKGKGIEVRKAL